MNMFARFDENPTMSFQNIKETKSYGRTHGWTNNVKTVYGNTHHKQKFVVGIINLQTWRKWSCFLYYNKIDFKLEMNCIASF